MAHRPHVRVEMRKVYVFGKSAFRRTRGEAYKQAARRVMRAACKCDHGCEADGYADVTCRFHVECECKSTNEGDVIECAMHKRLPRDKRSTMFPYWLLVCLRLQRFMAFVDSRLT